MKSYLRIATCCLWLLVGVQARKQKTLGKAVNDVWKSRIPTCEQCTPRSIVEKPGVGFDLNLGYATASITYYNGTSTDVTHIALSDAQKATMRKLSPPRVRYGPPFDSISEQIAYNLDQARRYIRHTRGLPSTEDIAHLAEILIVLKDATSLVLGHPVTKALVTTPWLANLEWEDFDEVYEFAGLESIPTYGYENTFQESSAALAASGYGLCEHYRDYSLCKYEEKMMEHRGFLAISFTAEELSIERLDAHDIRHILIDMSEQDRSLGHDAWCSNQANTTFWDLLGDAVVKVVKAEAKFGWKLEDLVIYGEYGEEKKFLDAIWNALGGIEGVNVQNLWRPLQTSGFSAEFGPARGAAELARREQSVNWECREPEWCESGNKKGVDDHVEKEAERIGSEVKEDGGELRKELVR